KVFFEDLGDGEPLTCGKPPARDLLRVEARTILGLLTSGHATIDGRVVVSASCHGSVPRSFDHLDVVDRIGAEDALAQLRWAARAGCARGAPRLAAAGGMGVPAAQRYWLAPHWQESLDKVS